VVDASDCIVIASAARFRSLPACFLISARDLPRTTFYPCRRHRDEHKSP